MTQPNTITRRGVLRSGIIASSIAVAGCQERDRETTTPPADTQTDTQTTTTQEDDVESQSSPRGGPAPDVAYWAWFPEDPDLWGRSTEPYDIREGDRRWLAEPTESESVRIRIENDSAPGNAGFYLDLGPISTLGELTITSEIVQSADPGDQTLLVALYFDRINDGDYFDWTTEGDHQSFHAFAGDAEAIATIPSGGETTLDDATEFDLVPPTETNLVTFSDLKRGLATDIDPTTQTAIQLSVLGSGPETTEETLIHDISVTDTDAAAGNGWPMYSHDTYNTGSSETTGPTTGVEPRWTFDTNGSIRSSPAVAHDAVYIGSDDGTVYAVDVGNGAQRWAFETGGPVESSPAVLHYMVYVGSTDDHLYALTTVSGDEVWAYETEGAVRSNPTVEANAHPYQYDTIVGFGSDDGSAYLLDAMTREELQIIDTDGPIVTTPITLVTHYNYWEFGVGSTDGYTYWWIPNPVEGDQLIDRFDAGAPVRAPLSAPTTQPQPIWFRATDEGTLFRMGLMPLVEWTFQTGGPIRTTPVIGDGLVYVGSHDNYVYAVDIDSGEEVWSYETGGRVESSPALADGMLYVGSADHSIYALDAETGVEQWSFETGGEVTSSPAVVNGTVYIGSADGTLYALTEPNS